MSPAAEPQIDRRRRQFQRHRLSGHQGAPCGMAGKARPRPVAETAPDRRPQPVGADERNAVFLDRLPAAMGRDGEVLAVTGKVFDPATEMECNIGRRSDCLDQRGLQVAAVDHPVGRAVARLSVGAERRVRKHAARRAHHAKLFGNDDMRFQPLAQPERDQDA